MTICIDLPAALLIGFLLYLFSNPIYAVLEYVKRKIIISFEPIEVK